MPYELRDEPPTPERFVALRDAADMASRSPKAVERGLPNSLFAVTVVHRPDGDGGRGDDRAADARTAEAQSEDTDTEERVVGMARIVGDGGSVYHVCDMAVHPDHQRQGLGSRMMERLLTYLDENAPDSAYVNLMADVEGFYERFGFAYTAPASRGMFLRVGDES
ncbi:GNAT family N-acetyltransferase [Halomicrococcus gelatinilyticus]|uniref:GNAT family N-acetyltransferase n=1 Tax=Halomicrococcus gelatinilyticus TaxID=1702103 RepID=UPI002E0D23E2